MADEGAIVNRLDMYDPDAYRRLPMTARQRLDNFVLTASKLRLECSELYTRIKTSTHTHAHTHTLDEQPQKWLGA